VLSLSLSLFDLQIAFGIPLEFEGFSTNSSFEASVGCQ
jgi:hypothetical protein